MQVRKDVSTLSIYRWASIGLLPPKEAEGVCKGSLDMSVREFVGIGNITKMGDDGAVTAALHRAGVDSIVEKLKHVK